MSKLKIKTPESSQEERIAKRKSDIGSGKVKLKLDVSEYEKADPENKYYWGTDKGDGARFVELYNKGWDSALDEKGEPIVKYDGTTAKGTMQQHFLMKMPMSAYKEIAAAKVAKHEETMSQIKTGNVSGTDGSTYAQAGQDGFFIPNLK
jgi:hypothetical protein